MKIHKPRDIHMTSDARLLCLQSDWFRQHSGRKPVHLRILPLPLSLRAPPTCARKYVWPARLGSGHQTNRQPLSRSFGTQQLREGQLVGWVESSYWRDTGEGLLRASLGPRPSRDSFTKEGLVSNVGMLGCAESACDLTIM